MAAPPAPGISSPFTRWAFGTTAADCRIATGHLLRAKLYPDTDTGDTISGTGVPGNGADGIYKRVQYGYNRLAEITSMKDPSGTIHDYSYDQHGRLLDNWVSNAELARHACDGLTRRTWLREGGTSGTVRDFFYNDQWRSMEERVGSSASAERQHLFHPANRWHLVLRDRDTDANGTLDERLYALQDAMDPVAVADGRVAPTDLAANESGMEFWKGLAATDWKASAGKYQFDNCKFVNGSWDHTKHPNVKATQLPKGQIMPDRPKS